MRNILAIVERELRAYFISPIAYVVLTIFVFLSGIFFRSIMVLWLVDVVANNAESPTSKGLLTYLSILSHLDDFMKGVLSTSHIIFYLSLMLVGLFLTYRSIDSLRWRG